MNHKFKVNFILIIVLTILFPSVLLAQGKTEKKKKDKSESKFRQNFIDTTDNALDVSRWLTQLHGFLPLPSIITEPALGYGLNLALVFMHPTKQSMNTNQDEEKRLALPSMTVAGGLYTASNTWGVYAGHYGSYVEDKLRIAFFTGWLNINISFYLTGPLGNENKLKFNLKGLPIYLSAAYRLGKSRWYAGLDYMFYTNEITLKTDLDIPAFDSLSMKTQLGGLGINVYRENFDNAFTPNKGTKLKFKFAHNDTWLGSDYQYNNFNVEFLGFGNWIKPWVLGLRVQTEGIFGDFPFYVKPFVKLRGIPIMRYQGDYIMTIETEQRVNITPRWAVDAFVGFGLPFDDKDQFTMANAKWAGGAGFRYLLARWFNLYMGIDVARGPMPDDWAWYIIFGSFWLGR